MNNTTSFVNETSVSSLSLNNETNEHVSLMTSSIARVASSRLHTLNYQSIDTSLTRIAFHTTLSTLSNNATISTKLDSHLYHGHPFFDADAFKLFMAILYGFIFLIGMPGNLLVILTIIRVPKMRTVKNLFIANLALGDLANILWCLPTSLLSLYISWPYGETVCKYIFPMMDVIIGNTIFTMVSITLDRYRAIVYPFTAKPSLRKIILVIVLTWMLSYTLMALPLVISMEVSQGYWVELSCNNRWKGKVHKLAYRLGTFFCLFCVPFTIVLYCFLRIKNKLRANIRFASASIRGRSRLQRAKKNKRLIKMLLVIFVCFTVCYLPINIFGLTITFYRMAVQWKYAGILGQLALAFLFSNSIMNPVILYRLSKDYKVAYMRLLKCFCPNSKQMNSAINAIRKLSATTRTTALWNRRTSSNITVDSDRHHEHHVSNGTIAADEIGQLDGMLTPTNDIGKFSEDSSYGYESVASSSFLHVYHKRKSVTWSKTDEECEDDSSSILVNRKD